MVRRQDIADLIRNYESRLEGLKAQQLSGERPAALLLSTEMADLEREIEKLKDELKIIQAHPSSQEQTPKALNKPTSEDASDAEFDLVISFAGEDRLLATAINSELQEIGIRTFYDYDQKSRLWGANLAEELFRIYSRAGRYCLLILSQFYLRKMWTRHERRAALSRAIREDYGYLLVYVVDDTEIDALDGISPDIGYLSAKDTSREEVVALLVQKVTQSEWMACQLEINRCRKFILDIIYQNGRTEKHLSPIERESPLPDWMIRQEYYSLHPDAAEISYLGKRVPVFERAVGELIISGHLYACDYEGFYGTFHDLTWKGWTLFEGENVDRRVFVKELRTNLVLIALRLMAIAEPRAQPRFRSPNDQLVEVVGLHAHVRELVSAREFQVLERYLNMPAEVIDAEIGNLLLALSEIFRDILGSNESAAIASSDIKERLTSAAAICAGLADALSEAVKQIEQQVINKE